MKLKQMQSLSIEILTKLKQLQQAVDTNESELVKLNNIPDSEYSEFRFIADELYEFAKTFDGLRDYGIE